MPIVLNEIGALYMTGCSRQYAQATELLLKYCLNSLYVIPAFSRTITHNSSGGSTRISETVTSPAMYPIGLVA